MINCVAPFITHVSEKAIVDSCDWVAGHTFRLASCLLFPRETTRHPHHPFGAAFKDPRLFIHKDRLATGRCLQHHPWWHRGVCHLRPIPGGDSDGNGESTWFLLVFVWFHVYAPALNPVKALQRNLLLGAW